MASAVAASNFVSTNVQQAAAVLDPPRVIPKYVLQIKLLEVQPEKLLGV